MTELTTGRSQPQPGSHHLISHLARNRLDIGGLTLNFQRTCRVPPDRINALPAGLGEFPVYLVRDFKSGVPADWHRDAVFLPMYPQEAMWVSFRYHGQPKALIVGAGNINAISGKPFDPAAVQELQRSDATLDIKLEKDQNYVVVPPQPWLDGWKATDNTIYQFVAAEMGSGETVEGQITKKEVVGGIQLIVFDAKKGLIPESRPREYVESGGLPFGGGLEDHISFVGVNLGDEVCGGMKGSEGGQGVFYSLCAVGEAQGAAAPQDQGEVHHLNSLTRGIGPETACRRVTSMGLGRGGQIEQKVYPDPYGLEVWNEKPSGVERIYLVSSEDFKQITGHNPPPSPVTYEVYQAHGIPWFALHDEKRQDTPGSDIFAKLKPVGEGKAKGV